MPTTISGTVDRVFADKGTWSSFLLRPDKSRQMIKASGNVTGIVPGCRVTIVGNQSDIDFKVISAKVDNDSLQIAGIKGFLASEFIKGVGYKRAEMICRMFGTSALSTIEKNCSKLTLIKGITKGGAMAIRESYLKNKKYAKLACFLKPGASDKQIIKLYEKYGGDAEKVILGNPYLLIYEVDGFGFVRADMIAKQAGIKEHDERRIEAAIVFCLQNATTEGHCYLTFDEMCKGINKLLVQGKTPEFTADEIKQEISSAIKNKRICVETDGAIFLNSLRNAEVSVVDHLVQMLNTKPKKAVSQKAIDTGIKKIEKADGIQLESLQAQAIKTCFKGGVTVITGGPGTGKSTIIKTILSVWNEKYSSKDVLLCAPTGKAASRMAEITSLYASTIHSALLSVDEGRKPLVIVDECSMIDISLASSLFSLVALGGRIILIGDPDQLPSIGAGNFLHDVIAAGVVPVVKLELTFRQQGKIAINAKKINSGKTSFFFEYDDTFQIIGAAKENIQETLLNEYYALVDEYGVENVCCICPMKKRSSNGKSDTTQDINPIIRDKLNPLSYSPTMLSNDISNGKGVSFRKNDRVMLLKNKKDSGFVNGDVGTIVFLSDESVTVRFDSGRKHSFDTQDFFNEFCLSYACTVHKSQGSEYKAVAIPITSSDYIMLKRDLLYTAVTRARHKVRIVGDSKYIDVAIRNAESKARNTKLSCRIIAAESEREKRQKNTAS